MTDRTRSRSLADILVAVAIVTGVSAKDIIDNTAGSRKRNIASARHMYCSIAVNTYYYTLQRTGRLLSGRNHSTIINSVQASLCLEETDETYRELIEDARDMLRKKAPLPTAPPPTACVPIEMIAIVSFALMADYFYSASNQLKNLIT